MSWTLAPSLRKLRAEVDERWPRRNKASDGTIGDTAHSRRKSEHNPDGNGVVRAIDITVDKPNSPTADEIRRAAIGDSRVHYVVSDGSIWSRTYGWSRRKYNGSNPHRGHVHISIRNNTSENASPATRASAASNTAGWIASKSSGGGSSAKPALSVAAITKTAKAGGKSDLVKLWQQALNFTTGSRLAVDGTYGRNTKAQTAKYQRQQGWRGSGADGLPGPQTAKRLAAKSGRFTVKD